MHVEYHKFYSSNLHKDMEFMVYGHAGKPFLIFPTKGGSFNECQDFGMVDALQPFIDAGQIQLFTVDSVDEESWCNEEISCGDRAWRHCQYAKYIIDEMVPFIRERNAQEKLAVSGWSYGAYHSSNSFFRRPDIFDTMIAISGPFHPRYCVGDYMDDNVYFHAPLAFLPELEDPAYLDQYRNSRIVVCVGQGYWEEKFLADTLELKGILEAKQIPAWIDIWGEDVAHDWPWWLKMMPHLLTQLIHETSPVDCETSASPVALEKAPAEIPSQPEVADDEKSREKQPAAKKPANKSAKKSQPSKKSSPKQGSTIQKTPLSKTPEKSAAVKKKLKKPLAPKKKAGNNQTSDRP